jgi:hypothetical protein
MAKVQLLKQKKPLYRGYNRGYSRDYIGDTYIDYQAVTLILKNHIDIIIAGR